MEQLGKPDELCPSFHCLLLGQVRIRGKNPHLKAGGSASNRFANLPETDDAERHAAELTTEVLASFPRPGADG